MRRDVGCIFNGKAVAAACAAWCVRHLLSSLCSKLESVCSLRASVTTVHFAGSRAEHPCSYAGASHSQRAALTPQSSQTKLDIETFYLRLVQHLMLHVVRTYSERVALDGSLQRVRWHIHSTTEHKCTFINQHAAAKHRHTFGLDRCSRPFVSSRSSSLSYC